MPSPQARPGATGSRSPSNVKRTASYRGGCTRPYAFDRSRLLGAQRRVVVTVRVVRHQGRDFRSTLPSAHVAYLERDGVTHDGEKARMFNSTEDRADA
jgi:hypothetical protein